MPLTEPFLLSQATVVDTKTLQRDATGKSVLVLFYYVNASVQYGSLGDLADFLTFSHYVIDCLCELHVLTNVMITSFHFHKHDNARLQDYWY